MSDQPGVRNHLIDAARVASVFVVVVFHCLLYQIGVSDGRPVVVPWGPDVRWWIASWFFMIMPVFFVAGGFAHAVVVDRMRERGTGYAHYLASRGRRLVGPLLLFVTVVATVSTVAAWALDARESIALSSQFCQLLWFITVYLVIVAVAPFMVRAHERWGAAVLVPFALAGVAVDAWSFAAGNHEIRNLNLLTVWPLCHQLGIAYHHGWFRRGPAWRTLLAIGSGATAIPVLILVCGYPMSAVGLANIPIANIQPPTIAMAFLGLAQAGVLGLLERAHVLRRLPAAAERGLTVAGALLMTTYLWHIPCILLAGGTLFELSRLLPSAEPVLLSQPAVAVVTLLLVVLVVPLIARVEYGLIPPLGSAPASVPTLAAFGVLTAGTALIWLHGAVVHPADPLSSVGLVLLYGGALAMRQAVGRTSPSVV